MQDRREGVWYASVLGIHIKDEVLNRGSRRNYREYLVILRDFTVHYDRLPF